MGVNPPFLKLYIRRAMKALKGIEGKRGLDKIFPKSGKPRTKLVWGRAPREPALSEVEGSSWSKAPQRSRR